MLLWSLLIAAQATAMNPQTDRGEFKEFGDWAVACDNTKECNAATLLPDGDEEELLWELELWRTAGPNGTWKFSVSGEDKVNKTLLTVDGNTAQRWRSDALKGEQADRFAAALAQGKNLEVHTLSGKPLATISLKGAAATFRYIDAIQGRVGTVTATVAKGDAPASSVPAPPPVPIIHTPKSAGASGARLSAQEKAKLWELSECSQNYDPKYQPLPKLEADTLPGGGRLVLVPCGSGAYNFSSIPYVLNGSSIALAEFDTSQDWSGEGGRPMLTNAFFDSKPGIIDTYAKGRGIGDCGLAERHVWDGKRFRMISSLTMESCRGSLAKLRVWTAKIAE